MIAYRIYGSDVAGGPIDYSTPIATTTGTSFVTEGLPPGQWWFGVRAFDTATGLEDQNIDCAVKVVIGASGQDDTGLPWPPIGVTANPQAAQTIRVDWHYPRPAPFAITGFHVYVGTGGTPDYTTAAATVLYGMTPYNGFYATLSGLTGGVPYTVGVRAFNAVGEEANVATVTVTATAAGPPLPVVGLMGTAVV